MASNPSARMRVAVRVDGGMQIGSGHVMRCLCLAEDLARRGAQVTFLCRDLEGHFGALIERAGHQLLLLRARDAAQDAKETREVLRRLEVNLLIIDHYGLDAEWERSQRTQSLRILVIDDLADRPHDCDLLVDQNYFGRDATRRYANLTPASCRSLLGPRYALLRPEYARLRSAMAARSRDVRRIMVFFGGTDRTNETGKALRALAAPQFAHMAVDVVLGLNHPFADGIAAQAARRPGTTLYRNLPTLAGLMLRADLAVGAGGVTTSERLCMGLPSVVVTVAPNQESPIASLAAAGAVVWAGSAEQVTETALAEVIQRAVQDPPIVPALVDGHGAARVGAVALPPPPSQLSLSLATIDDARLLFDWRNDDAARAASFDGAPLEWHSHLQWLESKLNDRGTRMLVARAGNLQSDMPGSISAVTMPCFDTASTRTFAAWGLVRRWSTWRSAAFALPPEAFERTSNPTTRPAAGFFSGWGGMRQSSARDTSFDGTAQNIP